MFEWIQSADWAILFWIQQTMKSGFLDVVIPLITKLGDVGAIWLLSAVVMLFTKKYRKCGIMLLVGLAIGFLIGNLWLKPMIARDRPSWIDSSVQILVSNPKDFSFPSGHTLSSVIAATILTLNNRKFGLIAIPLALLIAFSRMYLYVHFPSDIFVGAFLGVLIGYAVVWSFDKFPTLLQWLHKKRDSYA